MLSVLRYEIQSGVGEFYLTLPEGASPLHVDVQQRAPHHPSMWVLCDTDRPPETAHFEVSGTGTPMDDQYRSYVGTYQENGFVWHVWHRLT